MTLPSKILHWLNPSRLFLPAACIALPGIALCQVLLESQELGDEEVEEVRSYFVEMIIFEYTAGRLAGDEFFLPEERPADIPLELPALRPGELPGITPIGPILTPSFGNNQTIFGPDITTVFDDTESIRDNSPEYLAWLDQQRLEELPSHILQTRLHVLDAEEHAMQETYQRLRRLDAYKLIMRAAWTQAVYERDETLPIDLRRLGNPPLRLDGVITLYVSRYLHLVVDLTIDAGESILDDQDDSSPRYYGDSRTQNFFGYNDELSTAPVRYRIVEDRIFRNGEIRYYDHPRFGVLARITRVEEEVEDAGEEPDETILFPAN